MACLDGYGDEVPSEGDLSGRSSPFGVCSHPYGGAASWDRWAVGMVGDVVSQTLRVVDVQFVDGGAALMLYRVRINVRSLAAAPWWLELNPLCERVWGLKWTWVCKRDGRLALIEPKMAKRVR